MFYEFFCSHKAKLVSLTKQPHSPQFGSIMKQPHSPKFASLMKQPHLPKFASLVKQPHSPNTAIVSFDPKVIRSFKTRLGRPQLDKLTGGFKIVNLSIENKTSSANVLKGMRVALNELFLSSPDPITHSSAVTSIKDTLNLLETTFLVN